MLSEDAENQLERQRFKYRCFEQNQRKRTTILAYREIARQKLAYAGHVYDVIRGSSGRNALVILKGKIKDKKQKVDQRECGLPTSGNGQY